MTIEENLRATRKSHRERLYSGKGAQEKAGPRRSRPSVPNCAVGQSGDQLTLANRHSDRRWRQRSPPTPTAPRPRRVRLAGSGTGARKPRISPPGKEVV